MTAECSSAVERVKNSNGYFVRHPCANEREIVVNDGKGWLNKGPGHDHFLAISQVTILSRLVSHGQDHRFESYIAHNGSCRSAGIPSCRIPSTACAAGRIAPHVAGGRPRCDGRLSLRRISLEPRRANQDGRCARTIGGRQLGERRSRRRERRRALASRAHDLESR